MFLCISIAIQSDRISLVTCVFFIDSITVKEEKQFQ